jgi:hypothetical protein
LLPVPAGIASKAVLMLDDDLDGKLGITGNEPPIFLHGSIADLTYRANKAGYPTISAWVDALEQQVTFLIVLNGQLTDRVASKIDSA